MQTFLQDLPLSLVRQKEEREAGNERQVCCDKDKTMREEHQVGEPDFANPEQPPLILSSTLAGLIWIKLSGFPLSMEQAILLVFIVKHPEVGQWDPDDLPISSHPFLDLLQPLRLGAVGHPDLNWKDQPLYFQRLLLPGDLLAAQPAGD